MSKSTCWLCDEDSLRWNSDFNYDEVFCDGDGIVSYLTCTKCGAEVQYSLRADKK